jgi:hypothetical protein
MELAWLYKICFLSWRGDNKRPFLPVPVREVYMINHSDRFYLIPPKSIANIFSNWLNGVDSRFKVLIWVGPVAIVWPLYLCKNDKVVYNKLFSLMQIIYQCTDLLRLWSSLQRLEDRDLFTEMSTRLEKTTKKFINQHVWLHNRRILPPTA